MNLKRSYLLISILLMLYPLQGLVIASYSFQWSTCISQSMPFYSNWTQNIFSDILLFLLLFSRTFRPMGFVFIICFAIQQLGIMHLGTGIDILSLWASGQIFQAFLVIFQIIAILSGSLGILIWIAFRLSKKPGHRISEGLRPKNSKPNSRTVSCAVLLLLMRFFYNAVFFFLLLDFNFSQVQLFLLFIIINCLITLFNGLTFAENKIGLFFKLLLKNYLLNFLLSFATAFIVVYAKSLSHDILDIFIFAAFIGLLLTLLSLPATYFKLDCFYSLKFIGLKPLIVKYYFALANLIFASFALLTPCFNNFEIFFDMWASTNLLVVIYCEHIK